MNDESKKLMKQIKALEGKIISEIKAEQADNLNAVQTVETPQSKEDQIDLALNINFN